MDCFSAVKMTALGQHHFLVSCNWHFIAQCDNLTQRVVAGEKNKIFTTFSSAKLHFSEVLMKRQQFFKFLASQQGKDAMKALEQRMELQGRFFLFFKSRYVFIQFPTSYI